jgi:hypothetical protein
VIYSSRSDDLPPPLLLPPCPDKIIDSDPSPSIITSCCCSQHECVGVLPGAALYAHHIWPVLWVALSGMASSKSPTVGLCRLDLPTTNPLRPGNLPVEGGFRSRRSVLTLYPQNLIADGPAGASSEAKNRLYAFLHVQGIRSIIYERGVGRKTKQGLRGASSIGSVS